MCITLKQSSPSSILKMPLKKTVKNQIDKIISTENLRNKVIETHPLLESKTIKKVNSSKTISKIKMLPKDGLNFDRHGRRKRKIISRFKISANHRKLSVNFHYNSENSRKVEKQPLSSTTIFNQQPQQKISDRIQEKLNIIKNGY